MNQSVTCTQNTQAQSGLASRLPPQKLAATERQQLPARIGCKLVAEQVDIMFRLGLKFWNQDEGDGSRTQNNDTGVCKNARPAAT
jgi:hypothetical protein